MQITLTRNDNKASGIFSTLQTPDNSYQTLEHAYLQPDGAYLPKIPPGTYTCIRGTHRLHDMTSGFETFEITGVEGHTGLLFHWGNYNKDSEGCVLVGEKRVGDMVINSKEAFSIFMARLAGVNQLELKVI